MQLHPPLQPGHGDPESKERWEKFRDGILLPRMQQGIEGGLASSPEETVIDLYKVMRDAEEGSGGRFPMRLWSIWKGDGGGRHGELFRGRLGRRTELLQQP